MPTSIARLEMAAQRLQHAGEIAGVESSQSIVQLQEAVETLVGLEPQLAKPSTDWADLGPLLHQAVALVAPLASPGGVQLDTPASGQVLVQGPAGDLLDTFRCLLEQALACGNDPIFVTLRADSEADTDACAVVEVFNTSLDVSDALRRRLLKAIFARAGEAWFITESVGFRVKIRLPLA